MQQAKGYSECKRFDAKYIFSTNGHRYAKFNGFTVEQTGPFPFQDFPDHQQLTDCYHRQTGIKLDDPSASLLFQPDSPAYPESRYYQDAAIRAAFENLIRSEANGVSARVLLPLATGSGKTIIAANLLWRLHEAERLPKPALFLCDRDELREQALCQPDTDVTVSAIWNVTLIGGGRRAGAEPMRSAAPDRRPRQGARNRFRFSSGGLGPPGS